MRLPLILRIRPSRRLAALLLFVHGLAVLAVLWLAVLWFVKVALLAVISSSLGFALWRLRRQSGTELRLGAKGELKVGAGVTVQVLPETAVLPGVTVLALRCEGGKRLTYVLAPDALVDPDDYRRLRVWLKTSAAAGAA